MVGKYPANSLGSNRQVLFNALLVVLKFKSVQVGCYCFDHRDLGIYSADTTLM